MNMDKRVFVESIHIVSGEKTIILNEQEIKKICSERVQISIVENKMIKNNSDACKKSCKVILNRMSSEYIQNALLGKFIDEQTQINSSKTHVKNFNPKTSFHTKVNRKDIFIKNMSNK